MKAQFSTNLNQGFVAHPEDLKKLVALFGERFDDVRIRVDCADAICREFASVQKLLEYENPRSKEIRSIRISALATDFSKSAEVRLSSSSVRRISLDFSGREDVVSRLRDETLEVIEGMLPWYRVIHRFDFAAVGFAIYALIFIALFAVVASGLLPTNETRDPSTQSVAFGQLLAYGIPAVVLAIGIILNGFRDRLFPPAIFALGQGKQRFAQLERIQWGVAIGFIVSLVASIVVALSQSILGFAFHQ